jgi:outer membrane protein assembly factor BamB
MTNDEVQRVAKTPGQKEQAMALTRVRLFLLGVAAVATVAGVAARGSSRAAEESLAYWPQWRGPLATGEAPGATPPLRWGASTNVAWKASIPGIGKSTPIVWKDRVYVTSAVPSRTAAPAPTPASTPSSHPAVSGAEGAVDFTVIALNRADGSEAWRKVVRTEVPHEGTHRDGTYASGSALTDGERLYAYFGSRGLYALDFDGALLWQQDFGDMRTRNGFGEGTSPAVHDGTLVVTWDHEDDDSLIAVDAATGKEKWRVARDEPTTWATPLIVSQDGRTQVVVNGTNKVIGYDLTTGKQVWETGGTTLNAIPSPVAADGMVYAMAGFRGNMLRAIDLRKADGELTGPPGEAWTYERDTPYVPSPLLYEGNLYFLKSNNGILTCLDAASGSVHYTARLEAVPNVYASPVAADGRVYIVGRDGTTVVLKAGPAFEVLATNAIDEPMDASPALVGNQVYLRGQRHLYRIGE